MQTSVQNVFFSHIRLVRVEWFVKMMMMMIKYLLNSNYRNINTFIIDKSSKLNIYKICRLLSCMVWWNFLLLMFIRIHSNEHYNIGNIKFAKFSNTVGFVCLLFSTACQNINPNTCTIAQGGMNFKNTNFTSFYLFTCGTQVL